jgi:hypothetical protein
VVPSSGNTYRDISIGLAATLYPAGDTIFIRSFGSRAGSDAFDIKVTDTITPTIRRDAAPESAATGKSCASTMRVHKKVQLGDVAVIGVGCATGEKWSAGSRTLYRGGALAMKILAFGESMLCMSVTWCRAFYRAGAHQCIIAGSGLATHRPSTRENTYQEILPSARLWPPLQAEDVS